MKKTAIGLHREYVKDLVKKLEKEGYKIIVEGSIPKYRGRGWAEPDLFALKKDGSKLTLNKIIEVTIGDKKEGRSTKTTTTVEDKVRKIREYYDPPELVVFEPTSFTTTHYNVKSETKGMFTDYDQYNRYLAEKWKKEGLDVIFWNEEQL